MTADQVFDHAIHLAEMLPLLGIVWKLYRKLSRHIDVQMDFPPHRHTNGDILYPKDFTPGKIERRRAEEAGD